MWLRRPCSLSSSPQFAFNLRPITAGISITYRTGGGIFNLSRLKARTKTSIPSLIELQYADDNAVCALEENNLQMIINVFAATYSRLGLSVNIPKTHVLFQPAPKQILLAPNIQIMQR